MYPCDNALPSYYSTHPLFPKCGVDGIRTTWHKFFQDSALPWECHMSIPPELLHHIVPRVGLEPTRLTALVPKTSVATITPPRQLFHQQIKDHFCFSTLQRYGILSYRQINRKNFLSYSYVLYKFCELLGEDEYLQYFPLLKSKEKLYQQDVIWKKICSDLQWEYIPTI